MDLVDMSEHTIEMSEDYCCGGGHCGPLPGYNFHCPSCDVDSFCRTGNPLRIQQKFKCLRCKTEMKVIEIHGSTFKIDVCSSEKKETVVTSSS
jgi:hypothetical protein